MEKQVSPQQPALRDVNFDLDAKLDSMLTRSLFSIKRLDKAELIEGLSGQAGGEFFARIFTKGSAFRSFTAQMGDKDVQQAVVDLFQRDLDIGQSIERHAGSNVARNRLRKALETSEGVRLHQMLIETRNGYELDSRVLSEEWGREVYSILPRTVKKAALLAKIRLPQLKHKESVKALEPYVREVSSNLLDGPEGGLVNDAKITEMLNGDDIEARYGVVSEFFSSSRKVSRLSRYLEKEEHRMLLARRLSENKPRALLAVMDAMVTGFDSREGVRNFASALGDKNSSEVLLSLAKGSLDDQELIFAAFNFEHKGAPIGKEVMRQVFGLGEVPFDRAVGVLEAVSERRKELFAQGQITAQEVKKGAGDISMTEPQMQDIIASRQSTQ